MGLRVHHAPVLCGMYGRRWERYRTIHIRTSLGLKSSFTIGFWTDSDIPAVMSDSHHCRYSEPPVMCRQDCRFLVPPSSVSWANTVGSWHEPTMMLKQTLSACGMSRQWCSSQHCRLELWSSSVAQDITAGLTCKPAVICFSHFIVLYNLFFIFLVESGFALYSLCRRHVH